MKMKLRALSKVRTIADLLHRLGDIPSERVIFQPFPGTATEDDIYEIERREGRICELVDGTLVEKTVGYYDSRVEGLVFLYVEFFAQKHDLGICFPGTVRLRFLPGLVRGPDLAFVSWKRLPNRELPPEQIPTLIPDLAVEVLSPSNTRGEMARKRVEYFRVGTRLVWEIDPEKRTARVYTAPERWTDIDTKGALEGGKVLPGFFLPLSRLFSRAGRRRKKN